MPTYLLEDSSAERFEIQATYEDMKQMCVEYNLKHIIQAPSMVTDVKGTYTRAGSEWQDVLKKIKKNAGKNSTIKV